MPTKPYDAAETDNNFLLMLLLSGKVDFSSAVLMRTSELLVIVFLSNCFAQIDETNPDEETNFSGSSGIEVDVNLYNFIYYGKFLIFII